MTKKYSKQPLGQLVDVFDSQRKPVTKANRKSGPYPYYGASGIQDYVDSYIFDGRYLLVGEDGAKWGAGDPSAYIIEGKSWVNNHAHIIRAKESVIDQFLLYFLNYSDLSEYITGAVVPKLTQKALCSIPIPVPSLTEQGRIVEEFDLLNSVIKAKEHQLSDLDLLMQTVFYELFGDLIENNRWPHKQVKDVCMINPPKSRLSSCVKADSVVSFLPMEDLPIRAGYTIPAQTRLLKEVQGSYTYFEENDVLMAKVTPCFENGKVGIASGLKSGVGFGSSELIVFRAKDELCKELVYFLVQTNHFVSEACKQLTGTSGLRRVPRSFVENLSIAIPPIELQKRFTKEFKILEAQKKRVQQSIDSARLLLQSRMEFYFGDVS